MDNETPVKPPAPDQLTSKLATASLALVILEIAVFSLAPFWISAILNDQDPSILGILFARLTPWVAIAAIIGGAMACERISASRLTLRGKNRAIASQIMGILFFAAYLAIMMLSPLRMMGTKGRMSACINHFKQIETACVTYAEDHEDQLPPDLDTLLKAKLISLDCLACPQAHGDKATRPEAKYLYFGTGLKLHDGDDKTILLIDRFNENRYLVVGFGDCHICLLSGLDYQPTIVWKKGKQVDFPATLAGLIKKNGWKLPIPAKP